MAEKRIESFEEFWPFYLREHSKPATRWFHFAGTSCGFALALFAIASRDLRLVPLALVAGYGPAWFSHFFIEGNKPASWTYPLWSFRADMKLWWQMMRKSVLALFIVGCASQPIPSEQQEAYFNCRGIIVDTASENLQRAGYITDWREGDQGVETKWTSYTIDRGDERRTLFLRYVVQAANDGVKFSIFERSDDVRGEAPWERITRNDVGDPAVVVLLEKIRQDVCGTDEPFFTPDPAHSTASR
jgi:hypothetical protein